MKKKYLTQVFPWLWPLRKIQRKIYFYTGMKLDKNKYSITQCKKKLTYKIFQMKMELYNYDTGFDIKYQQNKVFNLKLVAIRLNKLIIKPQETFSFWMAIKDADKSIAYKKGLIVKNGELTTAPGGGLCHMSNLLYLMFLHTPLTIIERHGHGLKDFPDTKKNEPIGVDATISEGWLDLKIKNETDNTFQINIDFDKEYITGSILSDKNLELTYSISNNNLVYYKTEDEIYQEVDIYRNMISKDTGEEICSKFLYRNKCKIGYELPENIKIQEK